MLFDPRPKKRREELFDREEEINELVTTLEPLTLLLGIRRVGKSSLLRVALNELENGVYIDARKMYFDSGGWITSESLIREFERALNSLRGAIKGRVFEVLGRVRGVSISGLRLELGRDVRLSEVLEALNEVGAVVGIDEAQYLRFYGSRGGREFLALLAYSYDNLDNLRFILTGSEVGLLHDFLGTDDYESPLYGRAHREVVLKPFPRELSIGFLRRGFSEMNVDVSSEVIEEAVDVLDGVPGWLVEFGRRYAETRDLKGSLDYVFNRARGFLRGELEELRRRSPRYVLILEAIARGHNRWELIRDYLSSRGQRVPNSRLAGLLRNLEKMSWIEEDFSSGVKRYRITDPVIERVLVER
ncbi:ATP-binding protein [Thermococcus sp. MV11]|uniref:AAA family ATPase n=1 Tax=Thermococcus sp. MV11 TaxID=1638267 RepID=UPI00142F98C0|nr:ATP-binding protein [Thermococcus sp. MV11]NJE04057.1 ATP-binding protein [Thermococcus sp. MV11]